MAAVAVALLCGNKLLRWTMADCTPGPPNAMSDIAGTNNGRFPMLLSANKPHPTAMKKKEHTEQARGPHPSSMMPRNSGDKKLKNVDVENMTWMNSWLSPVPPSVGRANKTLELIDDQPHTTPPKNMFCSIPTSSSTHRRCFIAVVAIALFNSRVSPDAS